MEHKQSEDLSPDKSSPSTPSKSSFEPKSSEQSTDFPPVENHLPFPDEVPYVDPDPLYKVFYDPADPKHHITPVTVYKNIPMPDITDMPPEGLEIDRIDQMQEDVEWLKARVAFQVKQIRDLTTQVDILRLKINTRL